MTSKEERDARLLQFYVAYPHMEVAYAKLAQSIAAVALKKETEDEFVEVDEVMAPSTWIERNRQSVVNSLKAIQEAQTKRPHLLLQGTATTIRISSTHDKENPVPTPILEDEQLEAEHPGKTLFFAHQAARVKCGISSHSPQRVWDAANECGKALFDTMQKLLGGTPGGGSMFVLQASDPLAYDAMWEYVEKAKELYGAEDERTLKAKATLAVFKANRPA